MRVVAILAGVVLWLTAGGAPGHAEKRVALVVGNDRYANLAEREQLRKAVNDARAVGAALGRIGFEVIPGENLGRQALIDKLDAAAQKLGPGDTVFFFFSGHGVAVDGANYILPADVPEIGAGQVTRLTGAAVSEDYITAELLRSGARIAVVVLDACRDNPFARPGTKGVGGEKGLQPHDPPSGVFSFYAANRGEAALDRLSDGDRDPNSVFTRALVPALTRPGLDLPALAVEVREEVTRLARTVRHEQHPAYYDGTSGGRVFLAGLPRDGAGQAGAGGAALLGGMAAPAGPAADEVAWSFVKDSRDADLVRRFIAQYPASPRRAEAVRRLAELERAPQSGIQTAAVVPPVAPAVPPADPCAGVVTVSFSSRCAAPLTAAQERGLKPKDSFRECENCPEMVVVPAGSFTMGSPENEKGRDKKDDKDESPQHVVTIAKPFAVDKFDVTKAQFAAFVAETKYDAGSNCYAYENNKWVEKRGRSWRDPGFTQDGTHPAVCLNWDDATAYVDWLARKTGKPYRLLTEAEWEYAARGRTAPGSHPRFWFGDDEKDLCRNGNGADQTGRDRFKWTDGFAPCRDGYATTSPVGSFAANAFGLYDMLGNAWQWTADCYHDSYQGAPADGSAWTIGDCSRRVVRGGSWIDDPRILRAAIRGWLTTEDRNGDLGFRVGRTLTP